jgi:uncharacterized membrane protein (UPF0136 family)
MGSVVASETVPFPRAVAFFRRHPVWLFLCFTPGIPEYLSGSSPLAGIVVSPGGFLLFLGLNLGLYGPGVLLVREAYVRWKPGWAGLLLLGAAYGLLEEGTALSTLFNPHASVVGALGSYGRFAGVNWVWTVGVLGVHIVYSVGLPILLLGLALPETRGRPLLTPRQVAVALVLYAVDILVLVGVLGYYRTAPELLLGAALVAGFLYAVARRLPHGSLDPRRPGPALSPGAFFGLGLVFFPILLLVPSFGGAASLWPPATIAIDAGLSLALFLYIRAKIGRSGNEPALILLALGAILPIVVVGVVSQILVPVVLVADGLFGLFFYALWRRYRPRGGGPPPDGAS